MKIRIDEDLCTGCELCVETVPTVFELKEDTAVAKVSEVAKELLGDVETAAEDCPVEAIMLEE